MKKLIALCFLFFLAAGSIQAQTFMQRVNRSISNGVKRAYSDSVNKRFFVDVYFISTGYVPSSHRNQDIAKTQLRCHAVVYTNEGALAIDGDCWKKLQVASQTGEIVHMFVDLKKFGTYGSVEGTFNEDPYGGPTYGDDFFFSSDLTDDLLSNSPESLFKPVKDSHNKVQYFIYRKQMVRSGSQVGNAIKNAYRQAQRKNFSDVELKTYFQNPAVKPTLSYKTISDNVL